MLFRVVCLLASLSIAQASLAAERQESRLWHSGPEATPLLELYTSEGCSSCPPAERWFNELENEAGLWQAFVPVVWHVDYWNYLGWEDRFAEPRYSQRQYDYRKRGNLSQVYTPGVMAAGREFREWRRGRKPVQDDARVGELRLRADNTKVELRFRPLGTRRAGEANLVLLGMDLSSDVTRGENRGRQLEHQFVVLDWQRAPLDADGDELIAVFPAINVDASDARYAVAAWVSEGQGEQVIQSVGGWLR